MEVSSKSNLDFYQQCFVSLGKQNRAAFGIFILVFITILAARYGQDSSACLHVSERGIQTAQAWVKDGLITEFKPA
jgi:hypothetical protein